MQIYDDLFSSELNGRNVKRDSTPRSNTSNMGVLRIETDGVTMPEYLSVCIDINIDFVRIRNEIAKSNHKT